MKKCLSYILPVILFIGIMALGYIKIKYHYEIWKSTLFNFDILIVGIYFLWMVSEIKVSRDDVELERAISDYGTREFYGLSQGLTIFSALWFTPIWQKAGIYHVIGFCLFILGIIVRIWAVYTLGKYYSHVVRKVEHHKIIDAGPYKLLRHPAYTGMITAHIGITLFYLNYFTCAIVCLLLIPSIILRIGIEERTLFSIEGYTDFAKSRKKIIPYLW